MEDNTIDGISRVLDILYERSDELNKQYDIVVDSYTKNILDAKIKEVWNIVDLLVKEIKK